MPFRPSVRARVVGAALAAAIAASVCSAQVIDVDSAGMILRAPDATSPASTVFTFSVYGVPIVTDVKVRLMVRDPALADLGMVLWSPEGIPVTLFGPSSPGLPSPLSGSGAVFLDAVLSDSASAALGSAGHMVAPFAGPERGGSTLRPQAPASLSAFNGTVGDGVWTLQVTDYASVGIGGSGTGRLDGGATGLLRSGLAYYPDTPPAAHNAIGTQLLVNHSPVDVDINVGDQPDRPPNNVILRAAATGAPVTTRFTFTVDGAAPVSDLDLRLLLRDPSLADLGMVLTSPGGGVSVPLFGPPSPGLPSPLSGSGVALYDTMLDDSGTGRLGSAGLTAGPFPGPEHGGAAHRPQGTANLSAFNGVNPNGLWSLEVTDYATVGAGSGGTGSGWVYRTDASVPGIVRGPVTMWFSDTPDVPHHVLGTSLIFNHHCRTDMDGNGVVQPSDIAIFVTSWFASLTAGTLDGDFDLNGRVQPADIAVFVSQWFADLAHGC